MKINVSLDIGSISVNTILMDERWHDPGEPATHGAKDGLFIFCMIFFHPIIKEYGIENIGVVAYTGSGGLQASKLTGGDFVNEIIAQSGSVAEYYPEVRTIIEMGGEDSKLIFMEKAKINGHSRLSDFSLNSLCAAGTGSFLDQQAKRIGVSIEDEFGELALRVRKATEDCRPLQRLCKKRYDPSSADCHSAA